MPVKISTSKGGICLCNSSNDPERSQCVCLCARFCLCVHNGPLVETDHHSPSGEGTFNIKTCYSQGPQQLYQEKRTNLSPLHHNTHSKLRLGLMGGMEISASVPMNAIISFLYRECSRDLWEGVGAISSLCWINAVILYQESLGITLNRAGFMQNGFKPSFFLNDGPNLLAHFKLLISFIFK